MNNKRALLVIIFVLLLFASLIAKLFDIQIVKSDELKYFAKRQQIGTEKINAERGLIYDRNNVLLVYNRNDISFYLDLRMVSNASKIKIAQKFSSIFGESIKHYLDLMNQTGKTICIQKKAPSDKAILLENFKVNGLFSRDDPTRVYTYDSLASHILGYVGSDYHGVDGVDKSFDNLLAGENGSMVVLRDAIGDMITVAEQETKPAVPGVNLVLTINKNYQSILEEELKNGVEKYKGKSAVGIIMNPNNGQILALANVKDFDPNDYWNFSNDERRDRAVTDTYEPGSTFKTFSMAALLDRNLCNLDQKVFAENGIYKFKNVNITDAHKLGWLTARQVIEESSNIGMSKLIQNIDNDSYYKYLRAFGFGNYTSVGLPGEVKGTLRKPNEWNEVSKAFISFGYGVTVTPIQLAAAYCAIVNGGILYQPQIILREVKHDGEVLLDQKPIIVRKVISEATSAKMRNLLVGVVKEGTGTNAQLNSVTVGGKTGTSQKLINGKYSKEDYNSSFVGFFPASNPKIVCLILVNSPEIGRYGGSVAAPIFKNVAERIINTNMDYFINPNKENLEERKEIKVMFAKNMIGNDEHLNKMVDSTPTRKLVDLNSINPNIMPDLSNYSLRDAILILNKIGVKFKVNGSGKIISQSITPGIRVSKGIMCVLNCKEKEITGTTVY